MKRWIGATVTLATLAGILVLGFLYSGVYPIGADDEHTRPVYWFLETLRENSVERAARGLAVPPLDDPTQLLGGGADYNDMCASCHLRPGQAESDMSMGLYPVPPNLTIPDADGDHRPAPQLFWIIKHGIKASGMPAWGRTHDDERIWAMVAFLQRQPDLTPLQYQILSARVNTDRDSVENQ